MALSKTDSRTIETIRRHIEAGNIVSAKQIAGSFLRSATGDQIAARRKAALVEVGFSFV